MPGLPNADRAVIDPRKISAYLLAPAHEHGGPKAHFFISFGWSPDLPSQFIDALRKHALSWQVDRSYPAEYGQKFELLGPLQAPDGSSVVVKSVWIILVGEDLPRLVTVVPA
jgi:filamentous hemagglutinin